MNADDMRLLAAAYHAEHTTEPTDAEVEDKVLLFTMQAREQAKLGWSTVDCFMLAFAPRKPFPAKPDARLIGRLQAHGFDVEFIGDMPCWCPHRLHATHVKHFGYRLNW